MTNLPPAPWTVQLLPPADTGYVFRCFAILANYDVAPQIASVVGTHPKAKATAEAIALLPDLIEALRDLYNNAEPYYGPSDSLGDRQEIRNAFLRAADLLKKLETL